jgi:hypothetical protein
MSILHIPAPVETPPTLARWMRRVARDWDLNAEVDLLPGCWCCGDEPDERAERREREAYAAHYAAHHGMAREMFETPQATAALLREIESGDVCTCCCEDHTSGTCPARKWNGCRGQGSEDVDAWGWAEHYAKLRGISPDEFFSYNRISFAA